MDGDFSKSLDKLYNQAFYDQQITPSLTAAGYYAKHLWQYLQPAAVIDAGCGRGTWLHAFHQCGATSLTGLDGSWNTQAAMINQTIKFHPTDLTTPFTTPHKYDLAISVETAEHLPPSAGPLFIKSLTAASDAILFSAAIPGQGGTHHINERPHSFWAAEFATQSFKPFDLFRPRFWAIADIPFYYRQNVFLYVREASLAFESLRTQKLAPLDDAGFMDCVHPEHYRNILERKPSFSDHARDFMPSLMRALGHRF